MNPDHAKSMPCFKSEKADKCAWLTLNELSEMLESTGQFDRAAAYALLGIGTATGAALAFDGSKDILKGLALGTASVFGLSTIVNSKDQRIALVAGMKDMSCALRAYHALVDSKAAIEGVKVKSYSHLDRLSTLRQRTAPANLSKLERETYQYEQRMFVQHMVQLNVRTNNLKTAFSTAASKANENLAFAVIDVRSRVRERLAEATPSLEEIAKKQRDRVVDMIGEVVRKRKELEKVQKDSSIPVAPGAARANSNTETPEDENRRNAQAVLNKSAGVEVVFQDCVDPATQRLVNDL